MTRVWKEYSELNTDDKLFIVIRRIEEIGAANTLILAILTLATGLNYFLPKESQTIGLITTILGAITIIIMLKTQYDISKAITEYENKNPRVWEGN